MSENTTTAAATGSLFTLGQIVITPGVRALELAPATIAMLIRRHIVGEWDLAADDCLRNMLAIQSGDRIFGAFQLDDQTRVYIITEHDRSSTCIMLPEDY